MNQAGREHLEGARQTWRAFWNDPRSGPLHLERVDDYCVCEVMYRSRTEELLAALRSLIVILTGWLPSSDLRIFILRRLGARIGRNVYIAPWVLFDPMYPSLIELEDDVFLGMGCRLLTHEYTTRHLRVGRVRIGKGSVIGGWATIRSGVTIGPDVTVGLHSYVNKPVPAGATVVGIPARVLPDKAPTPSPDRAAGEGD